MAKTNYNKHVAKPSEVTASVFSNEENLRYGEIVLCNSIDEPGIYIFTKNDGGETKIQKVNSVENIVLDAAIDTGATDPIVAGDTLYEMVSKLQTQINEISGGGESEAEKVSRIVTGVGLNEDGTYKVIAGDYVGTATSIEDAIAKLDAAITSVAADTLSEAKDYTDSEIETAINALDTEETAGNGEVFVKITEVDGIISGDVKTLSVVKDTVGLKYDLKLGDYVFGNIDIPQDQFLETVTFISAATVQDVAEALSHGITIELGKPYLKFVWKLTSGVVSPTYVDVSGLIDIYTAKDVVLSDTYTGTSYDIHAGTNLEDAVGKITNELTSIEESIQVNEIVSPEKTINVTTASTGTSIDVNIDNDTIVKDETVASQGKLSVKLDVEKTHIDTGYVRTQYTLKSSGSTYGVINDTRDVVVGDQTGFIDVTTEQVSDQEGNRTDKLTISPVIQETINNATGPTINDGNGLVTAWGVKSYIRDGMDGDGIMVGDDNLLQYHPFEYWRGKINFDSQSIEYDTVHEAFYKTDNNMQLLDDALGFDCSGQTVHQYPSARTQDTLLIKDDRTVMDALKTLDKAIDDMDYTANTEENKVFTGITQTNGHVEVTSENLTSRKLAGYGTTADTKVAATQTLGTALGNLQGQIDSMDYTANTSTDKVFTYIQEVDGKVSTSGDLLTNRVITGYAVGTDAKISATDKLGVALGKVQAQIDAMDLGSSADTNQVITDVTQNDGKVSHVYSDVTGRNLRGYAVVNTTDPAATTAKVVTGDTLGQALGKLQGQIDSMDKTTVAEENSLVSDIIQTDGRITATTKHIVDVKLSGYTVGADSSTKITSGDTLGQALGKLQGQVNGLDWTGTTTSDEVFTGITEADGKVSATTALITSKTLSGYTVETITNNAAAASKVASTDTLGKALGKLQGQINAMDLASGANDNKVMTDLTQTDGQLTPTYSNVTSRKLDGYSATADTKVAASQTLGTALGNLQGQIDSMDYTANTSTDKVFTYIQEVDGKVSTSADTVGNRILSDYVIGSDAKLANTDSVKGAFGKLQAQINAMDASTVAEANSIVSDVTETDGKITATTKHIVDVKLSGYTEGSDADITSAMTLGQALGNLQKQINSLDYTANTSTDKVFTYIAEVDGKITTSADTVGSRILSDYVVGSDAKLANTDSVKGAFGKLQGQINAMDASTVAEANSVVSDVTETDGKITATTKHIVDVKLSGYTEGSDADITSAMTLGQALGNLQKQINSMDKTAAAETGKFVRTVAEADGKVSETLGYILDSDVKIISATHSTTNVKEEWKIVNQAGTQLGDSIKIYKDQTLKSVVLSGDTSTTGQWLVFTYILADGSESVVPVDVSKFLVQAEFKSGVTADNSGIVHGVVDSGSESFLTVGANGFKLSGVQTAINNSTQGHNVFSTVKVGTTSLVADSSADTLTITTGNTAITLSPNADGDSFTIGHTDTSSQADISAGSGDFIKSVSLDTYGHVTGMTSGSETTVSTSVSAAGNTASAVLTGVSTGGTHGHALTFTSSNKVYSATTAGDADTLGGTAKGGLLTSVSLEEVASGTDKGKTKVTVTVGGHSESSTVAKVGDADTVDGYHIVVGSTGTTANTIYIL